MGALQCVLITIHEVGHVPEKLNHRRQSGMDKIENEIVFSSGRSSARYQAEAFDQLLITIGFVENFKQSHEELHQVEAHKQVHQSILHLEEAVCSMLSECAFCTAHASFGRSVLDRV